MKQLNRFLITFAFGITLILVMSSCSQEINQLINSDATADSDIQEARTWYDSQKASGVSLTFARVKASNDKLRGTPDWKHAAAERNNNLTAVQIPLNVEGTFTLVTTECKQIYDRTGDTRYMASLTEMVVATDKEIGNKQGFLMTTLPDKEYMEATNFKPFHSSYKHWPKDYSGLILYHNLDGKFANGWKIENGNVTKAIAQQDDTGIDLRLNAPGKDGRNRTIGVEISRIEVWEQGCWDMYTGTASNLNYAYSNCGSAHFAGYVYLATLVDDGSSGGSGGDYFGAGGVSTPAIPKILPTNPPCINLSIMANNTAFGTAIAALDAASKGNFEVLKYMTIDASGNYSFQTINGDPLTGVVQDPNGGPANPIDAVLHCHYNGLLPIFAVMDLLQLYALYKTGKIADINTFQSILVTSQGVYSVAVSDLTQFKQFGSTYFDPVFSGYQTQFNTLVWNYTYTNGITQTTQASEALDKFTKFLSQNKTGLTLMATDKSVQNITNKTVDSNNTVKSSNCK